MSEIAEIIFEENSTLLQVLDQFQVPELAGEVSQLNAQLSQLETQVSQLGRIVDQNQLDNQAQFNLINTTLGNQSEEIESLASNVTSLSENVTDLSTQVSSLSSQFNDLSLEVATFDTRITNNTTAISALNSNILIIDARLGHLEIKVDNNLSLILAQQTQITGLTTSVSSIESRMLMLENEIVAIKGLPGIVTPGVTYTLNNSPTTNPWVQNLVIAGTYGTRVRFGEAYQATFNNAQYIIKFLDEFGVMTVNSDPRNMAVNVGLQRFAYRHLDVNVWSLTTVNVSVYNN